MLKIQISEMWFLGYRSRGKRRLFRGKRSISEILIFNEKTKDNGQLNNFGTSTIVISSRFMFPLFLSLKTPITENASF